MTCRKWPNVSYRPQYRKHLTRKANHLKVSPSLPLGLPLVKQQILNYDAEPRGRHRISLRRPQCGHKLSKLVKSKIGYEMLMVGGKADSQWTNERELWRKLLDNYHPCFFWCEKCQLILVLPTRLLCYIVQIRHPGEICHASNQIYTEFYFNVTEKLSSHGFILYLLEACVYCIVTSRKSRN